MAERIKTWLNVSHVIWPKKRDTITVQSVEINYMDNTDIMVEWLVEQELNSQWNKGHGIKGESFETFKKRKHPIIS